MVLRTYKKIFKYCLLGLILVVLVHGFFSNNDENKLRSPFENVPNKQIAELLLINKAKLENAERISNTEKVCRRYNLGKFKPDTKLPVIYKEPPTPNYESFYYDLKHRLSWCPIYKAGSSTWLYNLALLGGATEQEIVGSKLQINQFVRNIFPALKSSEAIAVLPNTFKFFIVRHPFERILSAYRDKLENIAVRTDSGSKYYYKKYGRKIVSKYRKGGRNTNAKTLLNYGQYLWDDDKKPTGVEPTFKEFVRYLIDTDLIIRGDDHWIPFYLFCTPCWLTYDVIGKVETMLQDQLLIIHAARLQGKIKPHWRHKVNPFNQTAHNDVSEIAKVYFSQLNESDVKQLHEKFKLDFELFQYDETAYYKYVKR